MPTFIYTAKSEKGEEKSGVLEAGSKHELAWQLRQEGFFLVSVALAGEHQDKFSFGKIFFGLFKHVSLAEKMIFARHLATMIKAGLPLNKSLRILAAQTKNLAFKQALTEIEESVGRGQSFSESLARYPYIFSDIFISMVKVGETAGNMEEILKTLSLQMEKDHALRSKVKGAMVYPLVVVSAMLIIGILMMILVVPKLASIFSELKVDLPWTTLVVIGISQFLYNHFIWGVIILVLLIVFLRFIFKTQPGKKAVDYVVLHTPLISPLSRKINSARFARNLSSLIEAGVPIFNALQIVASTMSNSFFSNSLIYTAEQIQKGEPLSKVLQNFNKLYPPMVTQMVEVGETTGTLTDILKNLADFYEEEVDNVTKNLSSVVEPILMIIIGVAVGFFAVSMIQPMYSLVNAM